MKPVITTSRQDKAIIISYLGKPDAKNIFPLRMFRLKLTWPPVKQFQGFLCSEDLKKPPD